MPHLESHIFFDKILCQALSCELKRIADIIANFWIIRNAAWIIEWMHQSFQCRKQKMLERSRARFVLTQSFRTHSDISRAAVPRRRVENSRTGLVCQWGKGEDTKSRENDKDDEKPFAIYEGIKDSDRIPTVWHSGYYWHRRMFHRPRGRTLYPVCAFVCLSIHASADICLSLFSSIRLRVWCLLKCLSHLCGPIVRARTLALVETFQLPVSFLRARAHPANFSIYSTNYYDARYADNCQLL